MSGISGARGTIVQPVIIGSELENHVDNSFLVAQHLSQIVCLYSRERRARSAPTYYTRVKKSTDIRILAW